MDTVGGFGGEGNILGYKHTQGETLNLTSYVKDKVLKVEQRACKQWSWEEHQEWKVGTCRGRGCRGKGPQRRNGREKTGTRGAAERLPDLPPEEPAAGSRAPALAPLHLPQPGACFSGHRCPRLGMEGHCSSTAPAWSPSSRALAAQSLPLPLSSRRVPTAPQPTVRFPPHRWQLCRHLGMCLRRTGTAAHREPATVCQGGNARRGSARAFEDQAGIRAPRAGRPGPPPDPRNDAGRQARMARGRQPELSAGPHHGAHRPDHHGRPHQVALAEPGAHL